MKLALASFTGKGAALAEDLALHLIEAGHQADHTALRGGGETLADWTARRFSGADALVYIGATGIAVRAIAPHLRSKATDPAVIAIDEAARFCIPLVSGHIGGANRLAQLLADHTGAQPVITTATDLRGLFAVDTWAVSQGLRVCNPERIKLVSGKLLDSGDVQIRSDFAIGGKPPKGVTVNTQGPADVVISLKKPEEPVLWLLPPISITAGIGCRKGVAAAVIAKAFDSLLEREEIPAEAVKQVCSIDLKAEEPGLLAFCESRGLPFRTFSSEALQAVEGSFTPSAFVRGVTGVDNVCERSAVLGSGGRILVPKQAREGVTIALAVVDCPLTFDSDRIL